MSNEKQLAHDHWKRMRQAIEEENARTREAYQVLWDAAHPPGNECRSCTGELDPFEDSDDELSEG